MNPKITNYRVITRPFLGNLVELVVEAIADGWQPIGGVAIEPELPDVSSGSYSQAMVKYAPAPTRLIDQLDPDRKFASPLPPPKTEWAWAPPLTPTLVPLTLSPDTICCNIPPNK